MSHSPEQVAPLTPPSVYTAEQIYYLLADSSDLESRQELGALFDELPYNCGGIAVYETSPGSESKDDHMLIGFNGQLTPDQVAGLRQRDEKVMTGTQNQNPVLESHQRETKQRVRLSLPKQLGGLSIGGAAGTAMVGFTETLGGGGITTPDTTMGVIMAGLAYFATRPWLKKRQLHEAQQAVAALREHCLDDDKGGIIFLGDKKHSYQWLPEKSSEDELPDTPAMLSGLLESTSFDAIERTDTEKGPTINIRFGKLVKEALERDEKPGEFWHEYLAEKAEALSMFESQIEDTEYQIARLEGLKLFTRGHINEQAIESCRAEMQERYEEALLVVCDIAKKVKDRAIEQNDERRIAYGKNLLNNATTGEVTQAHICEMQLQEIINIVALNLNDLDLTDEGTTATLELVSEYLQGARRLLWLPEETQFIYQGLHDKISKQLPALPEWEAVKGRFKRV